MAPSLGGYCPPTHQFAYHNGNRCCQFAMEGLVSTPTCDSSYISIDSICCFHGRGSLVCPEIPCKDARGNAQVFLVVWQSDYQDLSCSFVDPEYVLIKPTAKWGARASSRFSNDYPPEKAIDGNIRTIFHTIGTDIQFHWIQLDFGRSIAVSFMSSLITNFTIHCYKMGNFIRFMTSFFALCRKYNE